MKIELGDEVELVTDPDEIAKYSPSGKAGVVIDGKMVYEGENIDIEEMVRIITTA